MKKYILVSIFVVLTISILSCQNFGQQTELPRDFEGKIVAIYREYQTREGEKMTLCFKDKYTYYVKGDKIALTLEQLPNEYMRDSLVAKKYRSLFPEPISRNWHTKYKEIYDFSQNKSYFFYLNPDDIAKEYLAAQSIGIKERYTVHKHPHEKTPILRDVKIKNLGQDSTIMNYRCEVYEIRTPIPDNHPDIVQKVWINPSIQIKEFPHLDRGLNSRNGDLNNSWMLDNGLCMYMEADILSKGFFTPLNNIMVWKVVEVKKEVVSPAIFKIPTKYKNGKWHYD